jgi:hypothetical protein
MVEDVAERGGTVKARAFAMLSIIVCVVSVVPGRNVPSMAQSSPELPAVPATSNSRTTAAPPTTWTGGQTFPKASETNRSDVPGWFSGEFPVNPERLQAFGKVDSATGDSLNPVHPLSPATGTTTRVSVASDGTQGDGGSLSATISADGRYVAFWSVAGNLVSGDTNGKRDVFVHDRQTGQTTRVSVASDGGQGNSSSQDSSISADGRYVAFDSNAHNLVPDDTNYSYDVFVHDCQTGQTSRVSVASDGTQGNRYSTDPSISADGRHVAFDSRASNLVPGDTNENEDIFVHDRGSAESCILPGFGDENGNPIQQHTEAMNVDYGGHEFTLVDGTTVFLPFRWTPPTDYIYEWGCKLISGAMVINYFAAQQGVEHRTDPITLNDWMAHNLTNRALC